MREEVRKTAVAGSFYPADPEVLSRQVREFLSRAPGEKVSGEIIALVSPHAGYVYSGQVAAYAFRLVAGMKFEAAVVVAPSHRTYFQGASVYNGGGYETPLGILPVAKELCRRLAEENSLIRLDAQAHSREHALEVQLPFLQETLGSVKVVPIILGDQSYHTCEGVARAIAATLRGKKVLLVASTDLSHFHPYDRAVALDKAILEDLQSLDAEKLGRDLDAGKGEACGGGAVITVMLAAKDLGADRARVLKYLNSGDVTGDRSGVVGYGAAVFYRALPPQAKESDGT